jgi:FtsZ-binding cell division protein ZapB
MNRHTAKWVALGASVSLAAVSGAATARAEPLDEIFRVSQASTEAAQASQVKVDRIADETRDLLQEYKTVMKQVDGLKVYNARLERQIAAQEERVAATGASIDEVTVLQRQMVPLLVRMIDGLESFVALDKPFHLEERRERIAFLRRNLDRPDIPLAEKYRQVMEAYRIEIEYGRKIDTYKETIAIDGEQREVDILRVGRIALLYQTPDRQAAGFWNPQQGGWEPLESREYRSAIRQGMRMANKQAPIDLLMLPIAAPGATR